MVLLQVYPQSVTLLPFEGDAPGTVDVQAVPLRLPPQGVKVEARDVQLYQIGGLIQSIEPAERPSLQILPHLPAGTCVEQLLEPLVPEALDHGRECN